MLQQQPGAVVNQIRGSQAQPLQPQPSLVPGVAVRAANPVPAQQAKRARLASSKLPPSCAGAVDTAATSASARTASASTNRAVSATGSAMSVAGSHQAAASSGMTWNPVRLMSPFEKASNASAGDILTCMELATPLVTALLCSGMARPLTYCMQHASYSVRLCRGRCCPLLLQQVQTVMCLAVHLAAQLQNVMFHKWRHTSCVGFISHHFDFIYSFTVRVAQGVNVCLLAMHPDKHRCRSPSCLSNVAVLSNQILSNVIKL